MPYNGQEIFERLGILIKWYNQLGTDSDELGTIHATAISRYDSGSDDRESITRIGSEVESQQDSIAGFQQGVGSLVEQYVTDDLRETLDSPYSTTREILEDLVEAMNEASPADTVDGNTVSATTPAKDPDNHRSDGTATAVTVTQMARDENYFEVVCVDDSVVERERWRVYSSAAGQATADLTTGEDYAWDQAGIESFKINPMPIAETGDSAGQLANWSLDGMLLGGNTGEEGKIYVEIEKTPTSITESGDQHDQTSNWSLAGQSLDNTDQGTLYVALLREPAIYLMTGDDNVELSDWSLNGVDRGTNTDSDGRLYVDVTESGGTYTVSLYKDPQRGNKVAEGSTGGSLPAAVTLSEQNSSGMAGSVDLDSYTDDDTDIVLDVPYYYVRLYADASRSYPLVAQGVSFGASASGVSLQAQGDSGLSGSVDLDYGKDDSDIELEVPLHYVRLYRQDPSGLTDDEKTAQLVAQGASDAASAADMELASAGGSGLTGQVDLTYTADVTGIELQVGWRIDDKWTFKTTSDEAGTFLGFFRDRFGVLLPSKIDGSETILDSVAE